MTQHTNSCIKCGEEGQPVTIGDGVVAFYVCEKHQNVEIMGSGTPQHKDTTLDKILTKVVFLGRSGTLNQLGQETVDEAKQALQSWRDKAVVEELEAIIKRCIEIEESGTKAIPILVVADRINALKETPNED